jgi:hypothetical protein
MACCLDLVDFAVSSFSLENIDRYPQIRPIAFILISSIYQEISCLLLAFLYSCLKFEQILRRYICIKEMECNHVK